MKSRYSIIKVLLVAFGFAGISSCRESVVDGGQGGLRVVLENVSAQTVTRSTPAELAKPVAESFSVTVLGADGQKRYQGPLTDETIPLQAGTYNVTAECGENPVIGLDAPYYVGTRSVVVEDGQVTDANLTCKVGNALISVVFGVDEAERERFRKFYKSCAVNVKSGGYTVGISGPSAPMSAYFRAGTRPELEFVGVLNADDRQVSKSLDLSGTLFPQVFKAADHAVVTLTLPEAESAGVVNIDKVQVVEAAMDETIPMSWLPVPQALPEHKYDGDGNLVGTDIGFTNCFPGMEWKAVVTDADGTEFRTVQGTGALRSEYNAEAVEWPYIPAGSYTATYYLIVNGEPEKTGTRTFTVGNPDIQVSVDGYTSYSRYLAGDVDAANACDAFTIYEPTVRVGVDPSFLSNPKYTKSVTTTVGGSVVSGTQNGNVFTYANVTGKEPSFTAYALKCNVVFDKASASAGKDVYITGLPVKFAPPSKGAGWTSGGTVTWNDSDNGEGRVRLGQNTVSQPQYIEYGKFAIPAGTKIECPYKVAINGATVQTTLTLFMGEVAYFEKKTSYMKQEKFEDTYVFSASNNITSAKANNSYGSGQTKSWVYYLNYKYAK